MEMKKYIVTKSTPYGQRIYAAGEFLELPDDVEAPATCLAMELQGPSGVLQTGPHYFALVECTRNGVDFKPGEVWPWPFFKEKPPMNLFAPVSERGDFEYQQVGNDPRGELRRKPASVDQAPDTGPTA
jgi:hypothetical protein